MTSNGRRTVLGAYERQLDVEVRHPTFGYRITHRKVTDLQARILGAVLVGDMPEYIPMTTR
ncbi:hypothetical protein ACQP0C_17865 [Nocardia sp. CA-129566]|uniref:hypothetical protein n=1 Tax=Nocardia sp. CA-129566 TaxID=3239976 RepID=UPI003D96DDBB